jgi:putative spermidine/putrescine transport system substrate-binding protein
MMPISGPEESGTGTTMPKVLNRKIGRRTFIMSTASMAGVVASRLLLPAPAIAKEMKGRGEVVVFDGGGSWGEAKKRAYFEPFAKETGIKVIPRPRGDTGMRAGILAGATRYDLAILAGRITPTFAEEGLLLPIDYSWFEDADKNNFDPIPLGEYSVPHIIYSLLIAYDGARFGNAGPASWADVWDVERFPGQRSLATGPNGATFEAALMADGVDAKDLYPLDWDRAFKSLDRIKPHIIKWWQSGAEGPQLIVDKIISAGSAWNGRISAANADGAKIGFTWNQGVLQYDNWVVLKGAKNVENAMKLVAFASRAENQAEFVKHVLYAPTNARAYDVIEGNLAQGLPTEREARRKQIVQNYEFWNAKDSSGETNNKVAIAQWKRWMAGAR